MSQTNVPNLSITAGTSGFGLAVTGGDVGIAVIEATASGDSRYWIAATGLNLAASLSLTSNVTAAVSSISLMLNQDGGKDSMGNNNNNTPLDWTQFSPEINPFANLSTVPPAAFDGASNGDSLLTFTPATTSPSAPAKLTRSAGSWTADGFLPGDQIAVTGSGTGENDGTYTVVSISTDGLTLTLAAGAMLVSQGPIPNVSVVSPPPINFGPTAQITVSGTLTNLNVFNLVKGSASFEFSEMSPVTVAQGGSSVTGATLITLGLYNISASAATGGFGLTIANSPGDVGYLGLAIIEPPAPASGTDSRYWIAVDSEYLMASLALGGVTATVTDLSVSVNKAGGTDASGNADTRARLGDRRRNRRRRSHLDRTGNGHPSAGWAHHAAAQPVDQPRNLGRRHCQERQYL